MLTFTPFGKKIGILRGQTSSMKYSPNREKTSTKEVKEQAENRRRSSPLSDRFQAVMFPSLSLSLSKQRKVFVVVACLTVLGFILMIGMLTGDPEKSRALKTRRDFESKPKLFRQAEVKYAYSSRQHARARKIHRKSSTVLKFSHKDRLHRADMDEEATAPVIDQVTHDKRWPEVVATTLPVTQITELADDHLDLDKDITESHGMATHENFDAQKVYDLFCSCRQDGDLLLLDCYVNAYEELCKLFRHFGTVFSFVTSDVEEKIGILRDYRKSEHAEQYKTIQSMLAYEVSSETVKKKKHNSGSRTLLRLHRALEFITEFLLKLRESDNHIKFSNVVTKAYDDTLAKHHPWLIKKAVHVAMYMLPSRPDLMKKMGLKDEEKDMNVVMELVKELNYIYSITQELYAKDKLLDLP
ncbi:glycolipid transfer protein domain-containing protein 1 [Plakobranchus ocellatus]|uniref:Glycolipid transfer protein domain-containing protein 1 n=1 Tax=Plakobranchus ocellatus TaxID=259542 RepID=A0AAV4CW32_9GAST|nr:glycolipid transfer protein domain-containing protein 1 [Plakobranchus ocellatus]